jgi:hypothetical protein
MNHQEPSRAHAREDLSNFDLDDRKRRPAVPELPLRHRITEEGLDSVRDTCRGWDRQWLLQRYLEFMDGKPAPNSADSSFLGWAKSFTKGRPPS